ncbi:uncharacterized protein LOC104432305 [Eucalyptus grandis]|uniref:uncharacterized protein LOC104432305 n=1 Tax=Eucalyptus grandis TaxID=71139 RepID=UPI00192ECE26|nr:uncharacterized protein LOC104432305 [Eucalyptus grandis]
MAKALRNIKEIEIATCKLMEEIMDMQEEESKKATTTNVVEFPLLTSLSLEELPNLRTFFSGKYCVRCPSLTKLRISGCSKMMTFFSSEEQQQSMTANTNLQQTCGLINSSLSLPAFFNQNVFFPSLEELTLLSLCGLRRIWNNDLPKESFSKLASITVRDCENLSHIFPSTLIERFKSLKLIEVFKCASLEALVEHVVVDPKRRQKGLVLLVKEVKLWHLPRLNKLVTSSTKAMLSLPSLTNVSLHTCHGLRYLFTNDTTRTLEKLEMLDLSGCDNMQEVVAMEEGEEQKSKVVKFSHLRTLKLRCLKSLISFNSGSCAYEFPSLKEFTIEGCETVEVIVGDARCKRLKDRVPTQQPLLLVEKVEFPNMESMTISHMNNVEKIWLDELASNAFSKLKTLTVEFPQVIPHLELLTLTKEDVVMMPQYYTFDYLRKLDLACYHDENDAFPSNFLLQRLPNLKELVVGCSSFEEIFPEDVLGHGEVTSCGGLTNMEKPLKALRYLKQLNLNKLSNLRRVWKHGSLMAEILKQIEVMHVHECHSLSIIFPSPCSFRSLRHLHVEDCAGLVHTGTVTSLVHLTELILRNCGAMEDVITNDGIGVEEISFYKLQNLTLDDLPSLESFSLMDCAFRFPSLEWIVVKQCPKMYIFCKGALRTQKLGKVLLSDEDDEGRWEGDLNTTIQTICTESNKSVAGNQ